MNQVPQQRPSSGKFFEFLGDLNWSNIASAALPGLITTAGQFGLGQMSQDNKENDNAFLAQQNELNRANEMQMLQARLAADQAIAALRGGGGGSGSAAAMANVKRQRLADLASTIMKGSELKQSALGNWLQGVQRPFLGG